MAIQLKDRILTLCTTVGTNDAIVGETKEGYQGWEDITYGNTVYYCITDNINWEVGYGSYLDRAGTPTIQRNVLSSSNDNEKLDLSGNSSIFCTYPSEKAVILNADDNMYYPSSNINANKFVGDGSLLTNLPNDNVWVNDGSTIKYEGDGSSTTQVWAENNGKKASMIQKSSGLTYFTGDGPTYFGTEADEVVKIVTNGTAQLALSSNSINAFQPFTAPEFIGDGAKITNIDAELNNLTPEAPKDGETYARNNATWVSISDSSGIPDAPVDGLMYGRKDGEWDFVADAGDIYTKTETNTLLDEKADKATTYTKSEVDVIDNAQDAKIVINNDEIARQQIEITNNSASIVKNDGDINKNILDIATNTSNIATNTGNIGTNTAEIASNASSIGTLSVQVNNNSQDIEALQEGIFFSSSYSADYPATANRDPETGNMYMQATGVFTFSYATCNQIFLSKTDEQGNTRQFTAIQPGDSLVLNEVESPNYGRYELVSVDDAGDYVVLLVNNKDAQGSLLAGAKVAFQAFPASGVEVDAYTKAESDAIDDAQDVNISANTTAIADTYNKTEINTWQADQDTQISENRVDISTKVGEAPEDSKQYGRKNATWTEVESGTLDIDALPALPTELEGTDLFVTERTGTNYKVSADELSLGTGGGTTDILPVLYSGTVTADGTVQDGTGFTCVKEETGKFTITFDTPLPNSKYTVTANSRSNVNVGYVDESENGFRVLMRNVTTAGTLADAQFNFVITGTETIAVGGGGGSYTPEPLVWEEVGADRELNTVYTNDTDVPRYVSFWHNSKDTSKSIDFRVDGVRVGVTGNPTGTTEASFYVLQIVPSGSNYELRNTGSGMTVGAWREARMPLAIGTGGGSTSTWVSFDGITGDILGGNNVSSITKNGVGDYTLNFTSPLANENYSAACATTEFIHSTNSAVTARIAGDATTGATLKTVSQLQVVCDSGVSAITRYDMALVCVSISSNT